MSVGFSSQSIRRLNVCMCVLPCVVVELPCLCALCYRGGVLSSSDFSILYTWGWHLSRPNTGNTWYIGFAFDTNLYYANIYRHMGKAFDVVVGESKSTRLLPLNFASSMRNLGFNLFFGTSGSSTTIFVLVLQ